MINNGCPGKATISSDFTRLKRYIRGQNAKLTIKDETENICENYEQT